MFLTTPLTFNLHHECKDKVATPSASAIPITYTLGTATTFDLNSAFTYSATTPDYCFTYSIYDPNTNTDALLPLTGNPTAPTPTRVSGATSILLNYAAGLLPTSS